jgi:glucose-6-phosphate isomerase
VNVPENLVPHKTFTGDRPSVSLLFNELNAYTCGQLLAIYEHRIATEGFIYNVNSFDQWGVELGKTLSTNVRNIFGKVNEDGSNVEDLTKDLNTATSRFIQLYVQLKKK